MKKVIIIIVLLSMLLVSALFINSCFVSRITENIVKEVINKAPENQSIEEAEIDINEGKTSSGIPVELPEGFPKSVPVYPDMSMDHSSKSTTSGRDFFSVGYNTKDRGEKVFNWYKKNMKDWEIQTEIIDQREDEKSHTIISSNGEYHLTVLIIENQYDEGTTVILTASEELDFN